MHYTVFWGGREGYQTLLNTDVKRELDHMGAFFKMAAGKTCWHNRTVTHLIYCLIQNTRRRLDSLGNCWLSLSLKSQPNINMITVYNSSIISVCIDFTILLDAQTVISFLKSYGLDKDYKVS